MRDSRFHRLHQHRLYPATISPCCPLLGSASVNRCHQILVLYLLSEDLERDRIQVRLGLPPIDLNPVACREAHKVDNEFRCPESQRKPSRRIFERLAHSV